MARQPARRVTEEFSDDAIDNVIAADKDNVAADLSAVLDELGSITESDIKIVVYKIPSGNSKWAWVTDLAPPINTAELMKMLKDQYGSGDYAMRIYVAGKIKTSKQFSIAADKLGAITPAPVAVKGNDDMMMMFVQMMQASSDRQMQMMQAQQAAQAASSQSMITAIVGLAGTVVPALMMGKDKTSELMAALGPFMQKDNSGGGLKETIETLAAMKGLLGNDGGGNSDDSIMGMVKAGLPLLGDLAKTGVEALQNRRQAAPVEHLTSTPIPQPQIAAGVNDADVPPPLLLVRDDILFFFHRGYEVGDAADMIFERLTKHGVTLEQLTPIVAQLQTSENWLDTLAGFGLDLRTRPEWAQQFIGELVSLFTQNGAETDDTERSGGSESNA